MSEPNVESGDALRFRYSKKIQKERNGPSMAKMTVIFDRCKGCELCTTACPKHIVALQHEKRNKEGVFTAVCTDENACIGCAMCAMICPDCAIVIEK